MIKTTKQQSMPITQKPQTTVQQKVSVAQPLIKKNTEDINSNNMMANRIPKNTKKQKGLLNHLKSIGFTNRLAIYLTFFLIAGLVGGFVLALLSIRFNYTGQLLCWTVVFTPLGTAMSIVLGKIVDKNRDENTGGNGDGIKFAAAQANKFIENYDNVGSENSPMI